MKELDKLVQQLHQNQLCRVCRKPAECIHHRIGRANLMLRYDITNLMPLCYNCHRLIHDGKINQWDYTHPDLKTYLDRVKNMSFKDYLLFECGGLTKEEYFKKCKLEIKRLIDADS